MTQEINKKELNIKYLFVYVLRHFRLMLCVGIALAVILGGFKGLSYIGDWESNQAAYKKAQEVYSEDLAVYEMQVKEYGAQLKRYENGLEAQAKYLEESILMNLDSKNVAQATASIYFKANANTVLGYGAAYNPIDSIAGLFFNEINYNADWDSLAQKYNTKPEYVKELVQYRNYRLDDIIKVTVSHSDAQTAEAILDEVIGSVLEQAKAFEQNNPQYNIGVSKNATEFVNDGKLFESQNEAKEIVTQAYDKIAKLKALKKDLVQPTLLLEEPSYMALAKDVIIFAVIGAFLGVLCVAGICALAYGFGDKVHSEEEFADNCELRLLGKAAGKKCHDRKTDRAIEALTGKCRGITAQQKEQLLAYNIKDAIGEAKNILVIGNAPKTDIEKAVNLINGVLPEVSITAQKDIINNPDAYELITQSEKIIAVEKTDYSKYTDIYDTAALIEEKENKISGCILV